MARRMVKKSFQQGRSERRGESYSVPYVEPLSDARTQVEDFFNILLDVSPDGSIVDSPRTVAEK
jgi:hypothetical protein